MEDEQTWLKFLKAKSLQMASRPSTSFQPFGLNSANAFSRASPSNFSRVEHLAA